MNHIYKYKDFLITESSDELVDLTKQNSDLCQDIFDLMADFIDDGYNITFKSNSGDIKPSDIIEKTNKLTYFKPIMKSGRNIKSKFSIVIHSIGKKYDRLTNVIDGMTPTINRLSDMGWSLYDFRVGSERPNNDIGDVNITTVGYYFSKPDIMIDDNWMLDIKLLQKCFEQKGLSATDIEEEKPSRGEFAVRVDFESNSYDGRLNRDMDETFEWICDMVGFDSYSWEDGKYHVYFYYYE
jgi:hypothetical protein